MKFQGDVEAICGASSRLDVRGNRRCGGFTTLFPFGSVTRSRGAAAFTLSSAPTSSRCPAAIGGVVLPVTETVS